MPIHTDEGWIVFPERAKTIPLTVRILILQLLLWYWATSSVVQSQPGNASRQQVSPQYLPTENQGDLVPMSVQEQNIEYEA
ncbi:MAG TPA: hypothetical protein VHL77_13020 [Ferruginibacter sp.]|nr:hypothetical protein [Ferruginibacter sp.]